MCNYNTTTGDEAQPSRWCEDEQDLITALAEDMENGAFLMSKITYTIEYQYADYHGEREITLDETDDRDPRDVMWARMSRQGELGLPMAYQSAKVVDEQYED